MKKSISILLAVLMAVSALLASCGGSGEDPAVTTAGSETETTETVTEETIDLPADLKFDGKTFTFGVVDNPNARNSIVMEDLNGEVLNDAQYTVVSMASDRLDINIEQLVMTTGYPAFQPASKLILAGDDVAQIMNVYCVDAPNMMTNGYLQDYADMPYIDLEKSWWDQGVNESLTLGGFRYAAIGDLSITTHDLSYALLFSQGLVAANQLDKPYDLVNNGSWTMDKMNEMMLAVLSDANGNGERDAEDIFGYLAAGKMVTPNFLIGAGERTLELNADGVPEFAMSDSRFVSVFEKIFAITYDNEARFATAEDSDVPSECRNMFIGGHTLFCDCSFFWIAALRDMDTDFGIIPYPKYNEEQDDYCSRVSYFMPPVIPSTCVDTELLGAVLELCNYYAMLEVTPAYYEITLKGKYARDEESIAMLDLIFSHRVIDLGDTLFCADIRDGFIASMYKNNDRSLASTLESKVPAIEAKIAKMMEAIK